MGISWLGTSKRTQSKVSPCSQLAFAKQTHGTLAPTSRTLMTWLCGTIQAMKTSPRFAKSEMHAGIESHFFNLWLRLPLLPSARSSFYLTYLIWINTQVEGNYGLHGCTISCQRIKL